MHLTTRTVKSSMANPIAITKSQTFNSPALRSMRIRFCFIGDLGLLRLAQTCVAYAAQPSLSKRFKLLSSSLQCQPVGDRYSPWGRCQAGSRTPVPPLHRMNSATAASYSIWDIGQLTFDFEDNQVARRQ